MTLFMYKLKTLNFFHIFWYFECILILFAIFEQKKTTSSVVLFVYHVKNIDLFVSSRKVCISNQLSPSG